MMSEESLNSNLNTPLVKHIHRNAYYTEFEMQPCRSILPSRNDNGYTLADRLDMRKLLIKRRRWIVDMEFVLAMAGLILMVLETELTILHGIDTQTPVSLGLKSIISMSTVGLVVTLIADYYNGALIRRLDTGVTDWHSVMTSWNWIGLFFELVLCVIHPFPGDLEVTYISPRGDDGLVRLDAILSILMMVRLYLVIKFVVVHSRLLTDTSTNSIGALSKVKINTIFVFKAAMSNGPGLVLLTVMMVTFIVNSWAMRTCEIYYHLSHEQNNYLETMWLVAITFLTIGYGDKTPQSYCGRYISIVTGGMGVLTTALLVAIVAQKLQQTRAEKYVFNFVSRMQIERRRKIAAANVVKCSLILWTMRRDGEFSEKIIRKYGDKLKQAVKAMKICKDEMEHVGETALGLVEISQNIDRIGDTADKSVKSQYKIETRVSSIEHRLSSIENKLDRIGDVIHKLAK